MLNYVYFENEICVYKNFLCKKNFYVLKYTITIKYNKYTIIITKILKILIFCLSVYSIKNHVQKKKKGINW